MLSKMIRPSLGLIALVLTSGCTSVQMAPRSTDLSPAERCPLPRPPVPLGGFDLAPEIAEEIYSPDNVLQNTPQMTGPFPRDVVWVWFTMEASTTHKQAAVDAVCGVVISANPGIGLYSIRLPADATADSLFEAIHLLKTLPQVETASVDLNLVIAPIGHTPKPDLSGSATRTPPEYCSTSAAWS